MTETNKPVEQTSIENSVTQWSSMFTDLDNGGDTLRWQRWCLEDYIPAALFGQSLGDGAIEIGPIIDEGEETLFSFPCFFDPKPVTSPAGPGRKTKFNGKASRGVVLVTTKAVKFLWEHATGAVAPFNLPLERVETLNEVQFKASMLSMTAAGPGFELLAVSPEGEAERMLFRLALTPQSAATFQDRLRQHLGL